jgi:hypothetical protein
MSQHLKQKLYIEATPHECFDGSFYCCPHESTSQTIYCTFFSKNVLVCSVLHLAICSDLPTFQSAAYDEDKPLLLRRYRPSCARKPIPRRHHFLVSACWWNASFDGVVGARCRFDWKTLLDTTALPPSCHVAGRFSRPGYRVPRSWHHETALGFVVKRWVD